MCESDKAKVVIQFIRTLKVEFELYNSAFLRI